MKFAFWKKSPILKRPAAKKPRERLKSSRDLSRMHTKEDIQTILQEIVFAREKIIEEVHKIPDSTKIESLLAEQLLTPLREFISTQVSTRPAVKQMAEHPLSSNQAVKQKSLDQLISEMKMNLESLSQRHVRILSILAQQRNEWLGYDQIGALCTPSLTASCIRGYIADLINVYRIPLEKKNFGRQSKVRIPEKVWKQLAITKLAD